VLTVDLDRLGLRSGEWLLDAGCGGGRHTFGALDRGAQVVGVDLDLEGLRLTRAGIAACRRGSAHPLHAGVLRGDVFRLPFPDGVFHRVICAEVMEHVHRYEDAVRELVRVLRPGGRIGVTIPTAITEHVYLRLSHEYFESPGALRCMLGLHDETPLLTRAYRRFLLHATHSRVWQRVERVLDWVWPKSLVLYGTRVAHGRV
jgi:ubiquinone/menaquinone biosynthesis C-methylase UbiE